MTKNLLANAEAVNITVRVFHLQSVYLQLPNMHWLHTCKQIDRETDRQAARQTNRQTGRQTDRQTDTHRQKDIHLTYNLDIKGVKLNVEHL